MTGKWIGKWSGKKWPKKMTIWDKTCFWTWKSWKSKKLRPLLLFQLSKVATGDHFQDSKFKIWLKYPGLSLVAFFAPGPFSSGWNNKSNRPHCAFQLSPASSMHDVTSQRWAATYLFNEANNSKRQRVNRKRLCKYLGTNANVMSEPNTIFQWQISTFSIGFSNTNLTARLDRISK